MEILTTHSILLKRFSSVLAAWRTINHRQASNYEPVSNTLQWAGAGPSLPFSLSTGGSNRVSLTS